MTKRPTDIALSAALLCVLLPVIIVIGVLIWRRLGTPILFIQQRPGLHGRPFRMIKFRTLINTTERDGRRLLESERLTPLGRWLRSTSLDELPELWNVLRGEMSLVGPRPLLMEYLPLYTPEQARRHEVRPGITGWAQVNGRNALSWEDKFALDVWYVDNQSIWLDIKIMWLTLRKAIARDDILPPGQVRTPRFTGSTSDGAKQGAKTK